MLALKLLGSLLILFAGGTGALSIVRMERQRLSVLDAWIELLQFIRSGIDCYLAPLGDLFSAIDLDLFRTCMGRSKTKSFADLLAASRLFLSFDAHRQLSAFFREIGGGNREEQIKRCDYAIGALREIRAKQAEELAPKQKAHGALCICASLAVAILLW